MNKCKKIQDIIITDYIDGELEGNELKIIEDHLLDCESCRKFAQSARESMSKIHVKPKDVPEDLWLSIRSAIENENRSKNNVIFRITEYIKLLRFPRLVPVFGGVSVVILIVVSIVLGRVTKLANENEQFEYLSNLLSVNNGYSTAENIGLGTAIEEYFL